MTNFLLLLILIGGFVFVVGMIGLGYAAWRAFEDAKKDTR
jgi:hypothetical protein